MSSLVDRLLDVLRRQTGFGLVMATRVIGEDWRVVAVTENPYGVVAGDTFRWSDSICSRMVGSDQPGPWSIADVDVDVQACTAPVRTILPIASYLGAPLQGSDGSVIGTLCAIDPAPVDEARADHDLLAFAADFIATTLEGAVRSAAEERSAERRLLRSRPTEALVVERTHWEALVGAEIARTRWSGEPLTIAMARVAGGRRRSTSEAAALAHRIASEVGDQDAVGVLGSNRVGVLTVASAVRAEAVLREVERDLGESGIELRWVATEVAGADAAKEIEELLDVRLVGAAPASARAASALIVYSFCTSCGRKGAYPVPGEGFVRCRMCGAREAAATSLGAAG